MSKNVKFGYLVDPKNSKRVVTVARRVNGDTVDFGFAVCNPGQRTVSYNSQEPKIYYSCGDLFTKDKGRKIAVGRLEKHPISIKLEDGQNPMDAIRKAVQSGTVEVPPSARRAFG